MAVRTRIADGVLGVLNRVSRGYEYRKAPRGTSNPPTALELRSGLRAADMHDHDLFITGANHDFVRDERFQRAYQRVVQVGGTDFHIEWRIHVALWTSEVASHLDGAFVECGVARGAVMSAVLENLPWQSLGKRCILIDTFLPYLVDKDGGQDSGVVNPVYSTSLDETAANFAEWDRIELIAGRIPDVLGDVDSFPVAFLHIDMNAEPPERAALEFFWPNLVSGGIVLLDDYGFPMHKAQKVSADAFAASVGVQVLALPTGQGLLIKPPVR